MKKILIAVGIIILDWLLYLSNPLTEIYYLDFIIIVLVTGCTMIYFIYAKINKLTLITIPLFFILIVTTIFTTIGYVNGRSTLNAMGHTGSPAPYNLEYRVYWSTGDCIRNPSIDIPDKYQNLFLMSLIKIFGYQKGAFTGYFPTKEEIKNFIKNTKFKESRFELEWHERKIRFLYVYDLKKRFLIPYGLGDYFIIDKEKISYSRYNDKIFFFRVKPFTTKTHSNIFFSIKDSKYITNYSDRELALDEEN